MTILELPRWMIIRKPIMMNIMRIRDSKMHLLRSNRMIMKEIKGKHLNRNKSMRRREILRKKKRKQKRKNKRRYMIINTMIECIKN